MHDHLRHIAVFVDEPEPGQFYWVLIESTEDAATWADVQASEECFPTWEKAFVAGNTALLSLVPDPDVGPRATGEDEDNSPVGPTH